MGVQFYQHKDKVAQVLMTAPALQVIVQLVAASGAIPMDALVEAAVDRWL